MEASMMLTALDTPLTAYAVKITAMGCYVQRRIDRPQVGVAD
jgi:hypothetical protein